MGVRSVCLSLTPAMATGLKLESEAGAPEWGQALGLCSRLTTKACALNPPPPPSHCGFSRPRGGRRGRSRLQASSEGLTGGHSYTGRFPFNKVCLFPPTALGTLCQDRMTHWLPGLASLWTHSVGALLPEEQESSCCWGPRCGCGPCGVSSHRNTAPGRLHTEPSGLSPGAASPAPAFWLPSSVQIASL